MKTFNDLAFQYMPNMLGTYRAFIEFDNGYSVSVITGDYAQVDDECPYELAVLKDKGQTIIYPFGYDDVCGYLTSDDVTELMEQVQNLA